jgi:hypothetical protein
MKLRRLIVGSAVLLLAMLLISAVSVVIKVRQYPTVDKLLPDVHSFLEGKGYRLLLQARNYVTRTRPPLLLRLWGIPRSIRDNGARLGGVGAPYQHGYVCKYRSGKGKEIQVAIDVCDSLAYRVTLIGDTNTSSFFPEFADTLNKLSVPVGLEEKP